MSGLKHEHNFGYLNFFEIKHSGLYRIQRASLGEDVISRNHGLGTTEVFRELESWVNQRGFKETAPWPDTNDSSVEQVMCYCREIKEFPSGEFLLVLWKHDPADTQGYRGLEIGEDGSPTGNYISSDSTKTGANLVWGHPCYYWIIPNKNMVVSIKFDDSKCDSELMQKWVQYCVRFKLKFPGYNFRQSAGSATRISFSSPERPEDFNLIYNFSKILKQFKTSEADLKRICDNTKYVLFRNEVTVSDAAVNAENKKSNSKKTLLGKINIEIFNLLQDLLSSSIATDEDDNVRKVEIKLEASPSVSQFHEFLQYSSDFSENGWEDIIFLDDKNRGTSIKQHRIVERIVLRRSGDPYRCEQLYNKLSEKKHGFSPLVASVEEELESTSVEEESGFNTLGIKATV